VQQYTKQFQHGMLIVCTKVMHDKSQTARVFGVTKLKGKGTYFLIDYYALYILSKLSNTEPTMFKTCMQIIFCMKHTSVVLRVTEPHVMFFYNISLHSKNMANAGPCLTWSVF
jgi:hypothetical protein